VKAWGGLSAFGIGGVSWNREGIDGFESWNERLWPQYGQCVFNVAMRVSLFACSITASRN
jgi:hypothetical protein